MVNLPRSGGPTKITWKSKAGSSRWGWGGGHNGTQKKDPTFLRSWLGKKEAAGLNPILMLRLTLNGQFVLEKPQMSPS